MGTNCVKQGVTFFKGGIFFKQMNAFYKERLLLGFFLL